MATTGRLFLVMVGLLAAQLASVSAQPSGKCKVCCTLPKFDAKGDPIPGQFQDPICEVPAVYSVEFDDPNDACKASCQLFTCTAKCSKDPSRSHNNNNQKTRISCCCSDSGGGGRKLLQTTETCSGGDGDPHFQGPGGIYYDFHGEQEKNYCLMTDSQFHMNAHFIGQDASVTGVDGTWMDAFFFLYTAKNGARHTLSVALAAGAAPGAGARDLALVFDGQPIELPAAPFGVVGSVEAPDWAASDGSVSVERLAKTDPNTLLPSEDGLDRVSVRIRDRLEMIVQVAAHRFPDGLHLDFSLRSLHASPELHGVLGQMFTEAKKAQFAQALNQSTTGYLGHNGEAIVDGDFRDYQASELSLPDCKFTRYENVFNEQIGSVASTERRSLLTVEGLSPTAFDCVHTGAGGFRCDPAVV